MITKIKTRLASEEGFTLIELLVVIIILGILVAIAVPAYLSFRGSAQDAAGKANVRSAIPAAEEYYQTATTATPAGGGGAYTGLTGLVLRTFAPGVGKLVQAGTDNSGATYCIQDDEVANDITSATPQHDFYYIGGTPTPAGGTDYSTNAGMATVTSGKCPAAFNAS